MKCKYVDCGLVSKKGKTTINKKLCIINDDYHFDMDDSSNNMSRILNYQKTGAMIISAQRDENSTEENIENTKQLEKDIRSKGLGFRPCVGGFIENKDTPDESEVEEISFMIPKPQNWGDSEFLQFGLELCKKYNQESILVILPSINNGNPVYMKANTDIDMEFNNMRLTNPDDFAYTKLIKGNTPSFTFTQEDSLKNKYTFISNSGLTIDSVAEYYVGKLFPKSTKVWMRPHFNPTTGEFEPGFKERF